jgi:DNA sulfur modification protein DndB
MKSDFFRDIVDMERSSLAKRSRKLFTLSAFHNACADLIEGLASGQLDDDANMARQFWEAVAEHFPAWAQVRENRLPASEVREGYIHSHGIALQAIAKAGNTLLKQHQKDWRKRLSSLGNINWSRSNAKLWEGRALIGGKVSKVTTNVVLTTNVIKKTLGLDLDAEQQRVESALSKKNTRK